MTLTYIAIPCLICFGSVIIILLKKLQEFLTKKYENKPDFSNNNGTTILAIFF